MGASIYVEPIKHGRPLEVGTRSEFVETLNLPAEFDAESVQWLNGLAAGRKDWLKAITVILEVIEQHGRCRVWAEY